MTTQEKCTTFDCAGRSTEDRNKPQDVEIYSFLEGSPKVCRDLEGSSKGCRDFLAGVSGNFVQGVYLRSYLIHENVKIVLLEKNYLDYEYASQFQTYYGLNAFGYSNRCKRNSYFERVPSISEIIGESPGVWGLGESFDEGLGQVFDILKRWYCSNIGSSDVVDKLDCSLGSLRTIEGEIRGHFSSGKFCSGKNEPYCELRRQRREWDRKVFDKLITVSETLFEDYDVRSGNAIRKNNSKRGLKHVDDYLVPRKHRYLQALMAGFHELYLRGSACFYGFDTLVDLLAGMPEDQSGQEEWFKRTVEMASADHPVAKALMQWALVGYCVERPLPHAPIGTTVLRWPDSLSRDGTRMTANVKRKYDWNFLGIALSVHGLGSQMQDQATGACATQGLWSALQAGVYNHSTIPSSPVLTIEANKSHSSGQRTFPSRGLTLVNLAEAIRRQEGLSPIVIEGDYQSKNQRDAYFSKKEFNQLCAAFLGGGLPVLLFGRRKEQGDWHVICLTGFRGGQPRWLGGEEGLLVSGDLWIEEFFAHDVAIGPNAGFFVSHFEESGESGVTGDGLGYIGLDYHKPASGLSNMALSEILSIDISIVGTDKEVMSVGLDTGGGCFCQRGAFTFNERSGL